jgi:NAD(P)H-nitrite reductase large subunit
MELDDDVCLCFHVSQRKVIQFIRVGRPRHVGQLAECWGAGTGCGWCRPFLKKLFQKFSQPESATAEATDLLLPSRERYARGRADYVRRGEGQPPPGAEPIE